MSQNGPTTPEQPNPTDNRPPAVPPKSGVHPNPMPPKELPQDDPMPGALRKGD